MKTKPEDLTLPKSWQNALITTCELIYDEAYTNLVNRTDDFKGFYDYYEHLIGQSTKQLAGSHAEIALMINGMMSKSYIMARRQVSDGCPYYSFRPKFLECLYEVTQELVKMTRKVKVREET